MALRRDRLMAIIRANGHLTLDGTETTQELRDAVTNLYLSHSLRECRRPESGIPIGELITDIRVVTPTRMRKSRVRNVDMTGVYL